MSALTVGLDLGQAQDYSALAVVEHVWALPPDVVLSGGTLADYPWHHEFHVRALRRWPLGTSYVAVVEDVSTVMSSPALRGATLLFDATGVGRAVGDLFRDKYIEGRMGDNHPCPVTITAPLKENLISNLIVALQRGRLSVSPDLLLGDALRDELLQFRQKIRQNGFTAYEFERKGDGHGDLAWGLLLALYWGDSWVPGSDSMDRILPDSRRIGSNTRRL